MDPTGLEPATSGVQNRCSSQLSYGPYTVYSIVYYGVFVVPCLLFFIRGILVHMGVKSFLTRKMLDKQLKHLPKDQRELFIRMFEENPELFEKIAKEIKEKKKSGQDEMLAAAAVMRKYQSEMQQIMIKMQHNT